MVVVVSRWIKKENKRTEILYNFVQWQSIKHNLPHFVSKHTSWLLPTYSTVRSPFPYSVELGQKFIRTMVQMKNTKRYSRNYQIYYFWLSNCLYLFEHLMTGCIRTLLLSLSSSLYHSFTVQIQQKLMLRNCWIWKCDLFSSRVIGVSLQGTFTHSPNPQMEILTCLIFARSWNKTNALFLPLLPLPLPLLLLLLLLLWNPTEEDTLTNLEKIYTQQCHSLATMLEKPTHWWMRFPSIHATRLQTESVKCVA